MELSELVEKFVPQLCFSLEQVLEILSTSVHICYHVNICEHVTSMCAGSLTPGPTGVKSNTNVCRFLIGNEAAIGSAQIHIDRLDMT